jgi:predicted small lipoprotein YifL
MKAKAILIILAMALTVQACGVKNRLTPPDRKPRPADQPDPSQPPYPIGR